jgi:serine/threonine protein kinase
VSTTSQFGITPGKVLAGNYRVDKFIGSGWEGEVYLVTERLTGAQRAAKLFFPERNEKDRAALYYARKLERLRDCRIVIQYHHSESVRINKQPVTVLISEFVDGSLLPDFVRANAGPHGRLAVFEALHLLYAVASGLAEMHERKEYHGDLHAGNVLVRRRGIHFEIKLVDLYDRGRAASWNIREDVNDLIRIFYDAVGGRAAYAGQPPVVKSICLGLKRSLIHKRFPTAWHLCRHLDSVEW